MMAHIVPGALWLVELRGLAAHFRQIWSDYRQIFDVYALPPTSRDHLGAIRGNLFLASDTRQAL
jgi:hypothetical protein